MCPTFLHFKSVKLCNCAFINTILELCKYEIVQLFVSGQLQGVGAPATITISLHSYGGGTVSRDRGISPRLYQIVLVCAILEDCATSTMCYCVEF